MHNMDQKMAQVIQERMFQEYRVLYQKVIEAELREAAAVNLDLKSICERAEQIREARG